MEHFIVLTMYVIQTSFLIHKELVNTAHLVWFKIQLAKSAYNSFSKSVVHVRSKSTLILVMVNMLITHVFDVQIIQD